jgi:hypothetical protein
MFGGGLNLVQKPSSLVTFFLELEKAFDRVETGVGWIWNNNVELSQVSMGSLANS